MTCSKCGRPHSGICGIPPGVTRGYGARGGASSYNGRIDGKTKAKPGKRKGAGMLEELLRQAEGWQAQVTGLLKAMPPEAEEYGQLLDREGKLNHLIKQVIGQLAERRGG